MSIEGTPIGVIFSLIGSKGRFYSEIKEILFPSPIGVIFSLIWKIYKSSSYTWLFVSVSYRSYILSYLRLEHRLTKKIIKRFPSPIGVIFSLIKNLTKNMEYLRDGEFPSPIGVIFSLIMVEPFGVMDPKLVARFPSPIGVIFSLIFYKKGIFKEWKEKG